MSARTLVLVRHADAAHRAMRDDQRDLTAAGLLRARALGALLAVRIGAADLALVSKAVRARRTLERMRESLEVGEALVDESLYFAGPDELLEIADAVDVPALLLVGHEPTISETGLLLGDADARRDLRRGVPTATALVLEVPEGAVLEAGAGLPIERITAPERP